MRPKKYLREEKNDECWCTKVESAYKIGNDLLLSLDGGKCAILIRLDPRAAFNTVDHLILLNCLRNQVVIQGTVLQWFTFYLSDKSLYVNLKKTIFLCSSYQMWSSSRIHLWANFIHFIHAYLGQISCTFHFIVMQNNEMKYLPYPSLNK